MDLRYFYNIVVMHFCSGRSTDKVNGARAPYYVRKFIIGWCFINLFVEFPIDCVLCNVEINCYVFTDLFVELRVCIYIYIKFRVYMCILTNNFYGNVLDVLCTFLFHFNFSFYFYFYFYFQHLFFLKLYYFPFFFR